MITRAVGDWFGSGGIADRYIRLNGYPILDNDEQVFGVPGKTYTIETINSYTHFVTIVSHVMQENMTVMTAAGMTFHNIGKPYNECSQSDLLILCILETILENTNFQGFPVVEDLLSMTLIGYIGRSELRYLIGKLKKDFVY
jgi:chloride channel 3/4/5